MLLVIQELNKDIIFIKLFFSVFGLVAAVGILAVSIWGLVASIQERHIWGDYYNDDPIFWSFTGILVSIGFIIFLPFCISKQSKNRKKYDEWYETKYEEVIYDSIYSLNLQNEVSGYFVLGHGNVDTDSYYYFYIKSVYDTYKLEKLHSNNVLIKESNETPKIVQVKEANSDKVFTIICVPVGTVVESNYNIG